jgi:hypothetical protein
MNRKSIWKRKLYSILLEFFIFHFLSIFSYFVFSSSFFLFPPIFYVINILFFIQIAYFIFCKFYTKFKKIMVRESFLWLFFVWGMMIF